MALSDNLISYWSLDEASGTRVDAHGSNNLTDNNTVGSAAGKQGNGADFERDNTESLSRASNSTLQTGDIDFTFAFWLKLEATGAEHTVICKADASVLEYAFLARSFDVFRWQVSNDGGYFNGAQLDSIATFSSGTWYFIVCWHDAANNEIGFSVNDGTPRTASYSSGVHVGTTDFTLGTNPAYGAPLDGILDEFAFWKRMLTSGERTDLYNAGSGRDYAYVGGGTPGPLAAGTITENSVGTTTASLTVTEATGGTGPYTRQWHRSTSTGFTPGGGTVVSGATSLTLNDTGLTASTTYYYKVVQTDSAAASVTTTQEPVTTSAPTPPTAGTLTFVDADSTQVNLSETAGSGGTGTVTRQLQRATAPGGSYSNVSGQSSTSTGTVTFTDTTASVNTLYWYQVLHTDSLAATDTGDFVMGNLWGDPLVLGFVGDSITEQNSGAVPNACVEVAGLLTVQRAVSLGSNQGHSGAHTGTGANGWAPGAASNYLSTAKTAFASASVTHVSIMLGTNDAWANDTVAATFGTQLGAIVSDLVGAGYKVFLHYPPGAPALSAARQQLLLDYQDEIDALVDGVDVIQGDRLAYQFFGEHPDLTYDGVHPTNAEGNVALGRMWANGMDEGLNETAGGGVAGSFVGSAYVY